jgi:chaperonin GroEL
MGFKDACEAVKVQLNKTKVPVNDDASLINVATISANGETEVGKLIAEAIKSVGIDGAISVQEAKGYETNLIVVDGTYLDRGFESPYFITNSATSSCELDDPYILVINDTVTSISSIRSVLEKIAKINGSLLIVCNEIGGEAMQTLVLNRVKGNLKICAIKSPEFAAARTTAMQDLISLCGGQIVTNSEEKLEDSSLAAVLGKVKKAVITKTSTVLYGTKPDESHVERLASAKGVLSDPASTESERSLAERRIRRLSNGIAVIQVGGTTEGEMRERKDRVDDALHAAKAAMREGIQAGGGIALARAKESVLKKFTSAGTYDTAARSFLLALESPLRQITKNCGQSPDLVLQKALKMSATVGYNGKTNKFGDMFELGIVDPHLVVVSALEHAMSVSCNLLSIGCIILDGGNSNIPQIFNGL